MFSGSDRSRAVSRQPSPKVSADRLPAPLRLSHSQRAYLAFATSVWRDNLYFYILKPEWSRGGMAQRCYHFLSSSGDMPSARERYVKVKIILSLTI
jgi:hypothetical protein